MPIPRRDRAELESRYPDRFTDGTVYIEAARKAAALTASKIWDSTEWTQATGQERPHGERQLWAPELYELYRPYETERLTARWLSSTGIDAVNAYFDELNSKASKARDPTTVTSIKASMWFLEQALRDPDRRAPFSRAISQLDLKIKLPKQGGFQ